MHEPQPLGPRLAGALGWEAEYTGCCGHCLLLGGLCCGGPVLPEPGVGLGPQLPVRGEDAYVPGNKEGGVGRTQSRGLSLEMQWSGRP